MAKMNKVSSLVAEWDKKREEMETVASSKKEKGKKGKEILAPEAGDEMENGIFDNDVEVDNTRALFGDDSDDSDDEGPVNDKFPEGNSTNNEGQQSIAKTAAKDVPDEGDLFGSEDEESDEELIPAGKRGNDQVSEGDGNSHKKRRIEEDQDE